MSRTVAVISTLDTKGDQVEYLLYRIRHKGCRTITLDVGVLGNVPFRPEISRHDIARAADMSLDEVIATGHEAPAMEIMTTGAGNKLRELHLKGSFDGVVALGGSMGTALALKVLDVLPLGMPKLVVSTLANSQAIDPELFSTDLLMVPLMGGLWGLNDISKRVLDQVAGFITGGVDAYRKNQEDQKHIGITSLGMASSRYLYHLKPALEKRGVDASVYHATGMNVRFLEKAIQEGSIDAVLELQAGKELINEVCGSAFSPGPHRFEAAASFGIPQILSIGVIESCLWAPYRSIPDHFRDRLIIQHNPLLCMISTNHEEKIAAAKRMVEKVNLTTGPCAILIPMGESVGLKKLGFQDQGGLASFIRELKDRVKHGIEIVEIEASTDDAEFTNEVMRLLDNMI